MGGGADEEEVDERAIYCQLTGLRVCKWEEEHDLLC